MPRRRPADHPRRAQFARFRPLQAPPTRFPAPSTLSGPCRALVRLLPAGRTFPLRRFENRPCGFSLRLTAGRFSDRERPGSHACRQLPSRRVIRSRLILCSLRSRPVQRDRSHGLVEPVAQRRNAPDPGPARCAWRSRVVPSRFPRPRGSTALLGFLPFAVLIPPGGCGAFPAAQPTCRFSLIAPDHFLSGDRPSRRSLCLKKADHGPAPRLLGFNRPTVACVTICY